jgi:hypothetical protein
MATTRCAAMAPFPSRMEAGAPSLMLSPLIETIRPRGSGTSEGMCPELIMMTARAKEHYVALGSESMFQHAKTVLQAAIRGRLISQSQEGLDPFSRRVAELILYHPIESDRYLPSSGLGRGFAERFGLQLTLKRLDSSLGERTSEYVRLFNDPSTDHSDLLVALYTRIADMMTIQDDATAEAARVRIPGVFPMHADWEAVKASWAEPMLRIYCPIADWGGQTTAYREMRDNAMFYLHPRDFVRVSAEAEALMGALCNTNSIMYAAISGMAERFGLRVLLANDLPTVSEALPLLDQRTIAVAVRPFKGAGGLLDKSMKKGIPVRKVHDWSGATIITESPDLMYRLAGYLYSGGILAAARGHGVSDLHTIAPKDYALAPKPVTMYQSVHLDTVTSDPNMVPMELIVRTSEMHIKADEGTAGHDVYKLSPLVNGERRRFMERLAQISSGY